MLLWSILRSRMSSRKFRGMSSKDALEQSADQRPGSHQQSEGHWIDVRIVSSISHNQRTKAGRIRRSIAATRTWLTLQLQACTKRKTRIDIWLGSWTVSARYFVSNGFFRNVFHRTFMVAVIFIYSSLGFKKPRLQTCTACCCTEYCRQL